MASSSTPLQIIDDEDDDFDWEAAVLEIDVACNRHTTTSTTTSEKPISKSYNFNCNAGVAPNPFQNSHKNGNFNSSFSRQSTLDRLIGVSTSGQKKPEEEVKSYNSNSGRNGVVSECEGVEMLNGFVKIDPEAAKTWIYPVNVPRREYQFSITKTALFSNTLVVLPTGLGKTLIAAVVMYNYFRWFPEGKIVFAAPSRPLVMQQIEACHKIVGIPQEWTIDLTGQTSPSRRADLWRDKRVFFVTPQVLEKDIHSGSCLVKYLVCLVIDEAHRAMGNYSYCVAVRELLDTPVQLRILALTATPGSKKETIQDIINNLQISTLEHRNESDPDVLPYVHERKLEIIQVAMGDEAVQVHNLILEVVRPLVSRLSAFGLFPRRDFQTLSPCDLLNSRDKFRQEPPRDLPESKKGEIEGYFSVLITLYHVKKLLSSHGIKPALEMLEDKLKQGYFARLVSRNEILLKAKLIMQQTVSHGAPSPKLEKLLEVLTDHFKVKDPQNSRVIIFSNFRGSVRDILNTLTNLGEFVKATEFIGQSSGKTLKGQSQKVQQAVLQKFRTGGYNVIVATSIGEEGLDIMEVDLVICFDANISPLRMIQRMGRTGRKHEGRVVVLACEGSELKGYTRKQTNSKAIKKHMHNGGLNSFIFHSSPRMIPHIYKPEVRFIELSIEEFVPRGKNLKDDSLISVPSYKTKLTDAEKELLAKYFASSGETSWKPSLIVFPQIQAYPSSVNKVAHSSRTVTLIDTMQYLQGLRFSNDNKTLLAEDDEILDPCLRGEMVEPCDGVVKDSEKFDYPGKGKSQTVVESDIELLEVSGTKDVHIEDLHKQKPCVHSFMFGTEFVSVDEFGNVLILSLPQLPLKSHSKSIINGNSMANECNSMHNSNNNVPEGENVLKSSPRNPNASVLPEIEEILQTPVSNSKSNEKGIPVEDHDVECDTTVMELADDPTDELGDSELSPRLTNFIESGIVPESPIHSGQTPVPDLVENVRKKFTPPVSVAKETQTPLAKLSNTSNSRDWLLDTEVNPQTVEQQCKFKRLRKHGDINRKAIPESNEPTGENRDMRIGCNNSANKFVKGKKKRAKDAAVYIEEEAERSSDGMAFDDDDDDDDEDALDNSSYDDSFIDDGTNPTCSTTRAEASKPDMMAIYRRSLLSQSPFPRLPNYSTNYSPDSVVQSSRHDISGGSSEAKDIRTPQTGFESTARNSQLACNNISSELDSRKRKLSNYQEKAVPMVNLDKEFASISEAAAKYSSMQIQPEKMENDVLLDEDDLFYAGIDLDAIEEEATKMLRLKSEGVTQKPAMTSGQPPPPPFEPNFGALASPSFDLGF